MQLEPDTTARHRRLENRPEREVPIADLSAAPMPRTVPFLAARGRCLAAVGRQFVRLHLFLVVLILAPSSFAASRGYLSTVGPAPLRFEKSKNAEEEKAIMKPYVPPFLNVHPDPAAPESAATTAKAQPPTPVVAPPNPSAEPQLPMQLEQTEIQAGVPARPDQSAAPDPASQAQPDPTLPHDPASIDPHDPRAAEPVFDAAPLTPQMLLHFFQKRSADAGETESGVFVPMTFLPPPAPPHHTSKATYQRSFE